MCVVVVVVVVVSFVLVHVLFFYLSCANYNGQIWPKLYYDDDERGRDRQTER